MQRIRPGFAWAILAGILVAFAMLRPVDHDESQYVAAAVLRAHGLLPYRDFAYLQTPLQPYLFAPIAALAGAWSWPALRVVNALLGWLAIGCVFGAGRAAGASRGVAAACALLFACCDILLFSIGTARNDALPAACLAAALWLIVRADRGDATRAAAAATGLLLAAAAAAKISYALPALAYGVYALFARRHRPGWIVAGAMPIVAFVAWSYLSSPAGSVFGTLTFPTVAPAQYYAARPWKLSAAAKIVDLVKFLALGPAPIALLLVVGRRRRAWPAAPEWLILAGLVAAMLPTPTWRQYLLPMLPPLFVRLAQLWTARPPVRAIRIAAVTLACAGVAPSLWLIAGGAGMIGTLADSRAVGAVLDREGIAGPVATLSPQLLPAAHRLPDPRFATGPFYFRSHALLPPARERMLHLVSQAMLRDTTLPAAILVGGEDRWSSGDPALDAALGRAAAVRGYRPFAVGRLRLWIRPRVSASPRPAPHRRP